MRGCHRISRGFTLVELLTVCATVALGLALALPAVQQAREDARAQACKSNLARIGVALHNYHDVFNLLPPGWVIKDDKADAGPAYGWQAMILPFVDEAALYNTINFHAKPAAKDNDALARRLEVFRCPADESDDADADRGGLGMSNYAANYGVDVIPAKQKAARAGGHGIAHWNSGVGMDKRSRLAVKDGLSNTIFVGERCGKTGASLWPGVRSNGQADDTVATCNHKNRINTAAGSFSSLHEGGAYFLYGDGAVRFISQEIDSSDKLNPPKGVFQQLAHRDDGQKVDLDESTDFYQAPPRELQR